jgi:hypothetical protein
MPAHKQPPASLRYLKARLLQITGRPKVWGSAAVLLLAVVFLAEYWNQPTRFVGNGGDRSTLPAPGDSDTSLGTPAVPGTSSLNDGSGSNALGSLSSNPKLDPLTQLPDVNSSGSNSSDRLIPGLLGSVPPSANGNSTQGQNPFGTANSSTTQGSSTATPNRFSSFGSTDSTVLPGSTTSIFSNSGSSTTGSSTTTPTATSPLQSALDRTTTSATSTGQSSSLTSPLSSDMTQPERDQLLRRTQLTQPTTSATTGSSYSNTIPGLQQPQYYPQTSPSPGTTGYTLPPAFRTPANTPGTSGFSNFSRPQPVPGFQTSPQVTPGTSSTQGFNQSSSYPRPGSGVSSYSPTGYQAGQTQPTQVRPNPFSVPRAVPGRYIGNGQINTFSNP